MGIDKRCVWGWERWWRGGGWRWRCGRRWWGWGRRGWWGGWKGGGEGGGGGGFVGGLRREVEREMMGVGVKEEMNGMENMMKYEEEKSGERM